MKQAQSHLAIVKSQVIHHGFTVALERENNAFSAFRQVYCVMIDDGEAKWKSDGSAFTSSWLMEWSTLLDSDLRSHSQVQGFFD